MAKYSGYNIIPLGDHCAISLILKELKLRQESYPFDWVVNKTHLYDTNIIYNVSILGELDSSDTVDGIVTKYIGDAFGTSEKLNSFTNIWFPHDDGNVSDIFEKYKRRFIRLKSVLHKKNIFILLTRHYFIPKDIFQNIMQQLISYNSESILLFISGFDHTYFQEMNHPNVIFKYIEYDVSKYYDYDYSDFRPNIKQFLSELFK